MTRYRMSTEPRGKERPNPSANPIPHVKAQRTTDKMSDGQKEGVRVWNLMRKTLLDHGLMEKE